MRYGDKSTDVRDAQMALRRHGIDVAADGVLGPQTWAALETFALAQGKPWDPTVPDSALAALTRVRVLTPARTSDVRVYDLVAEQEPDHKGTKRVGGVTVMRDPAKVNTLCVHQTAVRFSVSEQQIDAAGGDRNLALARRVLNVRAHATAFRNGIVGLGHHVLAYVNGGGKWLNPQCVHLEVEGLYAGIEGNPATVWGDEEPDLLSGVALAAAQEAARRLCEDVRAAGGQIEFVVAHRQGSGTRRSDPGEDIWRELVLGYCVPRLKLQPLSTSHWGDGRPIPVQWDPAGGLGDY